MPSVRRFPPPWTAEETEACFIVRDANGQALASVHNGRIVKRTGDGVLIEFRSVVDAVR